MAQIEKKKWQELAEAARHEQDSNKLLQIIEELNRALEEQVQNLRKLPSLAS